MNNTICRKDYAKKKRVELHLHTKMSAMDSLISPEDAVRVAKEWGHSAIAITDRHGVQAFPEAMRASERYGVKVIYGMEAGAIDLAKNFRKNRLLFIKKAKRCKQIILVKNQTGLKNLYRLLSKGYLEYRNGTPWIPMDELEKYREGLLIGCSGEAVFGELYEAVEKGFPDDEIQKIVNFYDYFEIQPAYEKGEEERDTHRNTNREIVSIAGKYGKIVVATGNVKYMESEDDTLRNVIRVGLLSDVGTDFNAAGELYFHTTEEMLEEFSYLGKEKACEVVVENTNKIADMIEEVRPIPRGTYYPYLDGAEEELKNICQTRFKELYGEEPPQNARERLEIELSIILKNGYATLFMIAKRMVEKSESLGYHAGARGLVGSSFVAYLAGITDIDPLKFDIPYETFLGFYGDREPDIDLNFSPDIQNNIFGFVEEMFGADRVFRAGTIATLAEKTAYGYVRKYFDDRNISVSNEEVERLIEKCVGILRTTGQHPGGIMVVPKEYDIYDFTPIQHPTCCSDVVTTHFSFSELYGTILKLDVLTHDVPTRFKLLEELTGVKVSDIPLNDSKVIDLFNRGETYGLPEFGTPFVIDILKQTKPKTFDELLKISGLVHGTNTWKENAEELIQNGICRLSDVIACREDILLSLVKWGMGRETAFLIMESIRKGKGVTAEQEQTMKDFGVPKWYIKSCKKIQYLFPKAHAVAYVMAAIRLAWFKLYYPAEFYSSTLTVNPCGFENTFVMKGKMGVDAKIREIEEKGESAMPREQYALPTLYLVNECMSRGIDFLPVSLKKSEVATFLIENGAIRMPITAVWGTGLHTAQDILKVRRERNFESVEDLQKRANLPDEHIQIFRRFGVLDEFDK